MKYFNTFLGTIAEIRPAPKVYLLHLCYICSLGRLGKWEGGNQNNNPNLNSRPNFICSANHNPKSYPSTKTKFKTNLTTRPNPNSNPSPNSRVLLIQRLTGIDCLGLLWEAKENLVGSDAPWQLFSCAGGELECLSP